MNDDLTSPRVSTPKKRKSLIDIFKTALTSESDSTMFQSEGKMSEKILHYSTEKEKKDPNFKSSKLPKPEYFQDIKSFCENVLLTQKALSRLCKTNYIRKYKEEGFPKVPVVLILEKPHRKGLQSKKNDLSRADCSVALGVWRFNFHPLSICLPKLQSGTNHALLCIQLGIVTLDDQTMRDISEFILDWNSTYPYNSQFNHYSFAKSLLNKLGHPFDPKEYKEPFKSAFEVIIEKGPERFQNVYHIPDGVLKQEKNRKIEFKNQKDLDEFCRKIVNPDFIKNYPVDYEYLRGLNDTFWLKHYKARDDIDDLSEFFEKPLTNVFEDPRDRGVFLHPDKTLTQKKFVVA